MALSFYLELKSVVRILHSHLVQRRSPALGIAVNPRMALNLVAPEVGFLFLPVYMYAYFHVCACIRGRMCMHICAWACRGLKLISSVFPSQSSLYLLR